MSTKVPRFTAYKGVECAICAQPAHGQHFGVVTCRPCAAFFKRCVIEKSSYRCVQRNNQCNIKFDSNDKKCKACRLRQCNLVGMEYRSRKNSAESSEEEEEESNEEMVDEMVPSPIGPCPSALLKKLTAGYDLFLVRQKVHFQRTYRRNGGAEKIRMFVPENLDYIRHFEQSILPMFFDLFVECLEPFEAMEMDSKFALFDNCFAHFNLLNACFLSLRHFPGKNDQKFLIDFGHLMDMERKEEILQKWTKSINQQEIISQQRELIEKKFGFIQRLKKMGHKIGKEEICALMAIIISIKAPSNFEWKKMKASILTELLHFLFKKMNSMRKASKQFANLLTLLGQMDMFLTKHKETGIAPLQRPISDSIIEREMPMPMEIDHQNKEPNELEYFVDITNAYRRIWMNIFHDSGEMVVQRAEQFDTFEEFLGSGENILNFQHLFPAFYQAEGQLSKAEIIQEISQMQKITYHPRIRRKNIISRLLNVGLFKAMMHHRLHLVPIQDQVILNAQIGPAINALICTHFATQMGASTWSDADGLSGMAKLSANKMLREDCRFIKLAERAWIRPVKHFSSIKMLSQEEFSILLAILCTHTAIPDISDSTKELLYADQSRYSAMLLQYLQQQFGLESGAKRFAECMQLLNVIFYSAHNFDLLRTYLEAFHSPRGFTSEIVPKCLIPLM